MNDGLRQCAKVELRGMYARIYDRVTDARARETLVNLDQTIAD